ncbi:MAG: carboxypeptidase-like regulatory domain-containing protein, partial [Bacteroidota bacterium]
MRFFKYIIYVMSFVFLNSSLSAQIISVDGLLYDDSDKKPILGAIVQINNKEKSFTDEKGYFSIQSKAGKTIINITADGYEKFEKEINTNENLSIKIGLNRNQINLSEVEIVGNKKSVFRKISLYDESNADEPANIYGFYAVDLYKDDISNEIWFTDNKNCMTVTPSEKNPFSGKKCLEIKWDKQGGGCNWIGMGIGWDGWQGKDMATIMEKAAISIQVKTKGDTIKNLPLALALEDYSGIQAYTGFSSNFIVKKKITSNWTQVIIPLNSFPYKEKDLGTNNIKQFIIQFEADGEIFMDEIKLVPFLGNLKPKTQIAKRLTDILIDGLINENEWSSSTFEISENGKFNLMYDDEMLYLAGNITDKSPLINLKDEADIWNGDAIEFAIGTNPDADPNRSRYLLSDLQLGIKMCKEPYI